jgi:hypothetical protein
MDKILSDKAGAAPQADAKRAALAAALRANLQRRKAKTRAPRAGDVAPRDNASAADNNEATWTK